MNLNEIRYIFAQFTDRDVRPEEFDTLIDHSQRVHFRNAAGDETALRPFKVHRGIDANTPPLYVINGVATLPADFFKYQSSFNIVDGQAHQVEEVDDTTFDDRRKHSFENPTLEFPLINLQSNTVRVLPRTVQYLMFNYIKHPAPVHFAYTIVNGYVEYDPANSVELAWDEANQVEIIVIALGSLGIQASAEEIQKKR